jgi:hypothetical protein
LRRDRFCYRDTGRFTKSGKYAKNLVDAPRSALLISILLSFGRAIATRWLDDVQCS